MDSQERINQMIEVLHQYRIINILAVIALLGLITALYLLWARPYQLTWGATEEEIERPMPGDELDPDFLATRAITTDAPDENIMTQIEPSWLSGRSIWSGSLSWPGTFSAWGGSHKKEFHDLTIES